jgi:hypothetical protein
MGHSRQTPAQKTYLLAYAPSAIVKDYNLFYQMEPNNGIYQMDMKTYGSVSNGGWLRLL